MRVSGLVLAGGRGARLGGADKGWVDYHGEPLIRRAIARLAPQVDEVIVSANRNLDRYRTLGVTIVTDDPASGEFAGPLAGILAALRVAHAPWLAVVPCDAPEAPGDLVVQLAGAVGPESRAAVATTQGGIQPLFCLVRCDLAPSLEAFLAAGGRKAGLWLAQIGAVPVTFEDAQCFKNLNTPDDLGAPR